MLQAPGFERLSFDPFSLQQNGLAVRRHMLWDNFQAELGEYLAHLVGLIMRRTCGVASAGFRASVV